MTANISYRLFSPVYLLGFIVSTYIETTFC